MPVTLDGTPARKVIPVPNSSDLIVLFSSEHSTARRSQNLMRVRSDGTVVWKADLPVGDVDSYVDASWTGDGLTANSWSCYLVVIDVETGHMLRTTFTK